jgi:hypothetical protein
VQQLKEMNQSSINRVLARSTSSETKIAAHLTFKTLKK